MEEELPGRVARFVSQIEVPHGWQPQLGSPQGGHQKQFTTPPSGFKSGAIGLVVCPPYTISCLLTVSSVINGKSFMVDCLSCFTSVALEASHF